MLQMQLLADRYEATECEHRLITNTCSAGISVRDNSQTTSLFEGCLADANINYLNEFPVRANFNKDLLKCRHVLPLCRGQGSKSVKCIGYRLRE